MKENINNVKIKPVFVLESGEIIRDVGSMKINNHIPLNPYSIKDNYLFNWPINYNI